MRGHFAELGNERLVFPRAEFFLDSFPHLVRFHIAENADDAIRRREQACVIILYVSDLELRHAFLGAVHVESVAGVAVERAAHETSAALEQLIALRADGRKLHLALALEGRAGKERIEQHVGDDVQAGTEIVAQHFGVHAKTVVAAVAVDGTAHRFHLTRDLFRGARRGALQKHLCHQQRHAVVRRIFREHATAQHDANFHERQAMIFLHEQAQAVGEFDFLNRLGLNCFRFNSRGSNALGSFHARGSYIVMLPGEG